MSVKFASVLTLSCSFIMSCGDDSAPTCPEYFVMVDGLCLPTERDSGPDVAVDSGSAPLDAGADGPDATTECTPVDEECNALDDDCDGRIDEESSESCGTNVGVCTMGIRTCSGGALAECDGVSAGEEICDRVLDEDCDGSVDEGCACTDGETRPCGSSIGICESGSQSCGGGTWQACEGGVGGGAEICSGLDEDCDGEVDEGDPGGGAPCGTDVGECTAGVMRCVAGSVACVGERAPEAERCNARDDDCDGRTDEGTGTRYYRDADGDTRGDPASFVDACAQPAGYVTNTMDCDDTCNICWTDNVEVCDLEDNNCNGETDEFLGSTFFRDADGDGYGHGGFPITACTAPAGYVVNDDDCDDVDPRAHPGVTMFYSTPRTSRGEYDFNCDGTDQQEYTNAAANADNYCASTCDFGITWLGIPPACGDSSTSFTCNRPSSVCRSTGSTTRTQRCR